MNREHVKITVEPTTIDGATVGRTISVGVDGILMGHHFVAQNDPMVVPALLLVGFSKVTWLGLGWATQTMDLWQLRRASHQTGHQVASGLNGHRGAVELVRFQPKCFDHCMLDLFFDGRGAWKWAKSDLRSLDVLVTILQAAAFKVEIEVKSDMVHLATPCAIEVPMESTMEAFALQTELLDHVEQRQAA